MGGSRVPGSSMCPCTLPEWRYEEVSDQPEVEPPGAGTPQMPSRRFRVRGSLEERREPDRPEPPGQSGLTSPPHRTTGFRTPSEPPAGPCKPVKPRAHEAKMLEHHRV